MRALIVLTFPLIVLAGAIILGVAGAVYVSAVLIAELRNGGRS